ncbi:MAG: hypothetical protein ACI9DM_002059, partial [Cyclobacteriaceae bacterium]
YGIKREMGRKEGGTNCGKKVGGTCLLIYYKCQSF